MSVNRRAGCASMKAQIQIVRDDLSAAATQELPRLHLQGMHESSPPGTSFALDLTGLQSPDVTVWSGWVGPRIAGIGALKDLGDGCGEMKSMRTHPHFLRQGVAAQLLEHIIRTAESGSASCRSALGTRELRLPRPVYGPASVRSALQLLPTIVSWFGVVVPGRPRSSVHTVCTPPEGSIATPV